jgi:DNA-binding transcriptional regulator GbsR (MarR family)
MVAASNREFVYAWGAMGALLGFNASTTRVHALLIASDEAMCLDEIAGELRISRGNASMCLKELRSWGVVYRVKKSGDRRDFFQTESDVWKMALVIAGERKRRDFDPALRGLRQAISNVRGKGAAAQRLREMGEFLSVLDGLANRFLVDEEAARSFVTLLGGAVK